MNCALQTQSNAMLIVYLGLKILLYSFYENLKVLFDSLTGEI